MNRFVSGVLAASAFMLLSSAAIAEPEVVSGPSDQPDCYVPWTAQTKFFKYPKKDGPYRIALANGYIANTWRIQMIQTAKAYAAQPTSPPS
jgi:ribose transport system substrate-binding protein